jgi:tight adherence protein C
VIGAFAALCLECVALAPAAAVAGAAYPLLWLRDRIKARRTSIARALPYDLDLLTLSVEAGLDFAAALEKVVVKGRPGPLADELSVTVRELRLGTRREEALRNLAGRVDMPALSTFAQALIQADRMGTPLAKVLRLLATQLRVERTQRAEKLAAEAPVKLLLPLIGCIFPTIFLMLFGPIAWEVYLGGNY